MGIKLLNRLMKKHAKSGVDIIHLKQLTNKKIVIDISIYLYKYKSQNMLLTNIFKLCSILNHYNIDAIFVFDGRPTNIKMETLNQRSEQKYIAKQKYYDIIDNYSQEYIKTNKNQLFELKKSFTRVKKDDIENIKNLLKSYGMKYCEAVNEADQICGKLVNTICKDGCLSDDMDMFVYKSKYVYRNLDIVNETCLCYNLDLILRSLDMNFEDFKWMCILSQNDYNTKGKNVFYYYKLYKQYKARNTGVNTNKTFMEYVMVNEFMKEKEIEMYKSVHDMYTIKNSSFDTTTIQQNFADVNKVYKLLEQDNFIYPPSFITAC
jgi:5'-3' exonuclease